jgi:hypothetical protein
MRAWTGSRSRRAIKRQAFALTAQRVCREASGIFTASFAKEQPQEADRGWLAAHAGLRVSEVQNRRPMSVSPKRSSDIERRLAGRAVYTASLPGPLWTDGLKEAENMPVGKTSQKLKNGRAQQ